MLWRSRFGIPRSVGLVLAFGATFSLGFSVEKELSQPATVQAIAPVATALLSPLVELVNSLVTKLKPKKNDYKAYSPDITAMDTEASRLAPIPGFLYLSRQFRERAIDLSKFVLYLTENQTIDDSQWQMLKNDIKDTRESFDSMMKAQGVTNLALQFPDLQAQLNGADGALTDVQNIMSGTSDNAPAATKLQKISLINQERTNITTAAQWPEYEVASSTEEFLNQYKKIASELKKSFGGAGDPVPGSQAAPQGTRLQSVAFERPDNARSPDYVASLKDEIKGPVKLAPWEEQQFKIAVATRQLFNGEGYSLDEGWISKQQPTPRTLKLRPSNRNENSAAPNQLDFVLSARRDTPSDEYTVALQPHTKALNRSTPGGAGIAGQFLPSWFTVIWSLFLFVLGYLTSWLYRRMATRIAQKG